MKQDVCARQDSAKARKDLVNGSYTCYQRQRYMLSLDGNFVAQTTHMLRFNEYVVRPSSELWKR
jgi:hypothetical protein